MGTSAMPRNTAVSTTTRLCWSWWIWTLLPPPFHLHYPSPVPHSLLPVLPALHWFHGFVFPAICYALNDSWLYLPRLKEQRAQQSMSSLAEAKGVYSCHDGSPVLRTKGEVTRGTSGSQTSSWTSHHHCQLWRNASWLVCDDSKMSWAVAAQSSLEGKKFICSKGLLQLSTESRITGTRKSEMLPTQDLCLWAIIISRLLL